jgi:CRP-like cAMP-binding protein
MSLLTGEQRSANVSTQSKVVLLEVTKNSLLPLFEESPELIDEISKILTDRKLANEKALLTSNDSKEISNQVKAFAQKIVKFFFGTKN